MAVMMIATIWTKHVANKPVSLEFKGPRAKDPEDICEPSGAGNKTPIPKRQESPPTPYSGSTPRYYKETDFWNELPKADLHGWKMSVPPTSTFLL